MNDREAYNENNFETYVDDQTGTIIVSEVPSDEISPMMFPPNLQRAVADWVEKPRRSRDRGLFARDKFVTPSRVFEQMALAYDSAEDDIVANVLETSESLSFHHVGFECEDSDQEDVWNQVAFDIDVDAWFRSAYRELFLVSQLYGVVLHGRKTYKVRGKGEGGRARRASKDVRVPISIGLLDPLRCVPVSPDVFGNSRVAWIGSDRDMELVKGLDHTDDPFVSLLFEGTYTPDAKEEADLRNEGIDPKKLILLNDEMVFRHYLTKSPFERWSKVRMKSIYPLLDLKHQLREMDRAFMLGGINFIVLVTRGSDSMPTTRSEVAETTSMIRTQSKSPVIVSDHRINIELITPEIDHVLSGEKWDVLDERLLMKLWGTFSLPSQRSPREDSSSEGRVIARSLHNRRYMLAKTLERYVVKPTVEHPYNQGKLDFPTYVEFTPRRLELEFDSTVLQVIQSLRDRGDISRETILAELNFSQELEARRREKEAEEFDDIFTPVNVPFDSPDKTTPEGSGRQSVTNNPGGGNPTGKNGNEKN